MFVELGLHENKKLIGNSDAKNRLWEALYRYGDVFVSSDADIGRTKDEEFCIKLKEGASPIKQQARPLHPRKLADLESQIEKWLQADIIKVSELAWASPLVPVKKKDGTV